MVGTLNEFKLVGTIRAQSVDLTVTRANGDEFGKLKIEVVGAELRGTLKRGTVETNLEMNRIGGEGMSLKYARLCQRRIPVSLLRRSRPWCTSIHQSRRYDKGDNSRCGRL